MNKDKVGGGQTFKQYFQSLSNSTLVSKGFQMMPDSIAFSFQHFLPTSLSPPLNFF